MTRIKRCDAVVPILALVVTWSLGLPSHAADTWPQFQGDALRSGNAPDASLTMPLGLVGSVPLSVTERCSRSMEQASCLPSTRRL